MKNLYRLANRNALFKGLHLLGPSNLVVVDSGNSELIYVASPMFSVDGGSKYGVFRFEGSCAVAECIRLLRVPGQVVGLEHLALSNELCVATASGEVMVLPLSVEPTVADREPEVVTFCGEGLECMSWSPDQEVVIFVDCNLNAVTMNSAYDPINEASLREDTFGDREFMSVGWGKKETQFHGSEGKGAARKKKEDAEVTVVDLNKIDPKVRISWRADGEYFVVGFLGPFGRAFKVFNKEGALQFTSERCYGLETAMAWRPTGLWIAIPQVLKEKYVVALFEKNGLKHREIELPFEQEQEAVKGLYWSQDSEILVIHTVKKASNINCLYFYIICNYNWYLKQYLEFENTIIGIQWDLKYSEGRTLHVLQDNGYYEVSRWEFSVAHSVGLEKTDDAIVAVIEGHKLLLTNFRGTVVPPPMCATTVTIDAQINATGFLRNPVEPTDSNCFFVVDSSNRISFYRPKYTDNAVPRLKGVELIGGPLEVGSGTHLHWLWLRNDLLVVSGSSNLVKIFEISFTDCKLKLLLALEVGDVNDRIGCIEAISSTVALIETMIGQTFKLTLEKSIGLEEHITLPEFCEHLRPYPTRDGKFKLYSLRNRQNLYVDGVKLASDVTSIFRAERYLLFTTIAELKFVDTASNVIIGDRRVERGSKLVVVVPKASRTVFQLPRGNLEVIAPRILSLGLIAEHLDALEYFKAFDILRKERINLNLIVDHNPELFLSSLGRFLEEVTNVNWLNLFISDLQNQDVCESMYESNYRGRELPAINGYKVENKVEYLCDRLLEVLNTAEGSEKYTLPKITCYVKKGMLEKALEVVWDIKKTKCHENEADEALKYLLYLVDVNDLFNVALGMYDFGLVLFVATKSQKDPKEYLPFLNELKRMDKDYRRYRIDCHLKRYEKAIQNISSYEDDEDKFQEALQLVVKHGLYAKAMAAYKGKDNYYKRICTSYGDHLRQSNKQADASLIYEKAGDYRQAIASARNAVDWERCLKLVKIAEYSEEDEHRLVQSLLPALQEAGEFHAASRLAKDYLKNSKLSVEILLKDHLFEKATLEAHLADRSLVNSLVCPALDEYLEALSQKLDSEKEEFLKLKNRLLVVRVEREKKRLNPQHDEDDGRDVEDCDLYSDTSTVASSRYTTSSGRSGKSHRSSKNRRKHERKLLSLKEGNPYEDIALVDALHTLVMTVCGLERQRHIRSICKVAIELDRLERAAAVQRTYGALYSLVKYSLDAIWIAEMVVPGGGQDQVVEATAAATGDLAQVQNVQHYALIKPHQRYKPDLQSISWQFEVLK